MDMDIGDDGHVGLAQARSAVGGDFGEQAAADLYLRGAAGDIDGDDGHLD